MPFDLDPLPKLSKRVWCLGHLGLNGSTAAHYTEGFAALTQMAGWQLRTPTLQQALAHVPQDDPVLIHLSLVDQIPKPALRRAWRLGWQAGAAPKTVLVRVPKTWRRPGQILCLLAASLRCLTKPMSLRCVSQRTGPRRAFKHLSGLRLSRPKGGEGRAALLRHLLTHHPNRLRLSTAQVTRALSTLPAGRLRDDMIQVEYRLGQLEAAAERLALPQTGLIRCLALPGRPMDLPEGPSLSATWLDEPLGARPGRMTRREWLLLRLKAPQIVHAEGLDAPWDAVSLRSQIPRPLSNGLHFVGNTAPGSGLAMNSAMLREGLSGLGTGATWRRPVLVHAQNAHRVAPEQDSLLMPPETLRVGHLLWEYNAVPDAHLPGLARLDEIWAPSRFVEQLYTPVAPCPVHWVGKGLSLPKPQGQRPALCPTICVVLDSRSGLARKNPVAALRAFRAAFPPPIQAKLIIKMTPEPENGFLDPAAQRAEIFAAAARDPRIEIVEEMLPLPKLLGVIKSATALVSPHRGEGFGYVPAFALSIGVPAIVSDTGGVQDFCTMQTAWPVPGTQAPIVQETLPHPVPEGTWFEICEDTLAQTMVEVVEHPTKAAEKARRGAALMARVYSPQAYAKRLRARLDVHGVLSESPLVMDSLSPKH